MNPKATQTGSKITLKWNRLSDAYMYKVYGSYCSKKMSLQKTVKGKAATKVILTKKTYSLKKGKTAKVKARLVLGYKKKKPLGENHGKQFRYASSNKTVATVSKGGVIKAKKAGKCNIYIYAIIKNINLVWT